MHLCVCFIVDVLWFIITNLIITLHHVDLSCDVYFDVYDQCCAHLVFHFVCFLCVDFHTYTIINS